MFAESINHFVLQQHLKCVWWQHPINPDIFSLDVKGEEQNKTSPIFQCFYITCIGEKLRGIELTNFMELTPCTKKLYTGKKNERS